MTVNTDVIRILKKIRFYVTEPILDDVEKETLLKEILDAYLLLDDQSSKELLEVLIQTLRDIILPKLTDTDIVELEKLNKKRLINLKHMFGVVVIVCSGMLVIGGVLVVILDLIMSIVRDGRSIVLDSGLIDWIRYVFE